MTKYKKNLIFSITIYMLMGTVSSCKKFIVVSNPVDQLVTAAVYADSSAAEATVTGLYSQVMRVFYGNRLLNGASTLYCGLSADEFQRTSSIAAEDEFQNNALTKLNGLNYNDIWLTTYNLIYHSNVVLENLASSPALSESLRNKLSAEVKCLRAFNYFYLVNLYGEVPMPLSSDYKVNGSLARTDTGTIYKQLIKDLKEAQTMFAASSSGSGKLRFNNGSASALLARVFLYRKDWVNAVTESTKVIAGSYSLADPDKVFKPDSPEGILLFYPDNTNISNTREGIWFIPATATTFPTYALTTQLDNAISDNDLRRLNWIASTVAGGVTYRYPYKYKVRSIATTATKTEYNMVLRLAEQYLIRAEALAEQGLLTDAITDVDKIRARAGIALVKDINPSISKPSLLKLIYKERQIEFFAEMGHRWLDLKRTGRADAVLKPLKPNWTSDDVLYPIPDAEILLNPALSQNSGYN